MASYFSFQLPYHQSSGLSCPSLYFCASFLLHNFSPKAVPTVLAFLACLMLPSILAITFLFLQAMMLTLLSRLSACPSQPCPAIPLWTSHFWHVPRNLFWKGEALSTEKCIVPCIWCCFLEPGRSTRLLPAPNPQGKAFSRDEPEKVLKVTSIPAKIHSRARVHQNPFQAIPACLTQSTETAVLAS